MSVDLSDGAGITALEAVVSLKMPARVEMSG